MKGDREMIRTLEDEIHKLQLEIQDVYQDGAEGHRKCSRNGLQV